MINNRQVGRRRGRGGNNNGQRPGGGQQGNGSRIDNRSRGNATQLLEKYKSMAADAQRSGDRVTTEYYLQFADHYFRVLSEQRGQFEERSPQRGRNEFDDDGDGEFGGGEFGDEGEPARGNEQGDDGRAQRIEMRDRNDRPNPRSNDRQRDDRPRDDRPRDDRPREDRPRDDRPRDDRPRDDRPRGDRDDRPRGDRDGGARREGNSNGRDRGEWQERPRERRPDPVAGPPVEVAGQRRADPIAPTESLEARAEEVLSADRPLDAPPRRRGRPRRDAEPVAEAAPFDDGGLGADRLPPSLTLAASDGAPAEAKPRRRRARPIEDTPTAAE